MDRSSLRCYATHRDVSPSRWARYTNHPGTGGNNRGSSFPWTNLIKPLTFATLFTATSFGIAYYCDTATTLSSSSGGGQAADPDVKLKVLTGLIATNCAVFALHQIPPSANWANQVFRLLGRYGTLDPRRATDVPATLLTSGFSHSEIWHLGLNMVGLYTVGSALFDLLGRNQFLAFYGSAICWSSMAQLAVEFGRARRGGLARPSLGASGGIYALLGAVAWYAPTSAVYLLFVPFVPIQLGYAFTGMMAVDAVGLVRGWNAFGHAAHLTGGMTGLLYGVGRVPEAWMAERRRSMRRHLSRWGR